MKALRRALVVTAAVVMAVTMGAVPASAHNAVQWGSDGCLHFLHDNLIGSLTGNSDTCTGRDNFWAGRVRDDHATSDGRCVMAVLDGIRMADSCNSTGTSFTFLDPQRNSSASTAICWSNTSFCVIASNRDF